MPSPLRGKRIVLGVTGSIASYKALDIASKLAQAGALVDTVLTPGAANFVTPLAFRSLTHRPVITDTFDPDSELAVEHVQLASQADVVVVAPATAHFLARASLGLADDPLTTTLLATTAPVVVCPAMDGHMWDHPATQEHVSRLRGRGVTVLGPDTGRLASGQTGTGRLVDTPTVLGHLCVVLGRNGDLAGRTVVVSAGGTEEPIDPVRVITNRSSGKMGYALAEAARDRGARVVLVSAPTALPDPVGVEVVRVGSALQMQAAVQAACRAADALVMAAAVADFRPAQALGQKHKKAAGQDVWSIDLVKNPDILATTEGGFVRVGFAAESEKLLEYATQKLRSKGLHMIVANDISATEGGFGAEDNRVVILDRDGGEERLSLMPKYEVAHRVLDKVVAYLPQKRG